jgi:putative nucleotidyltransferase with HDIG domain
MDLNQLVIIDGHENHRVELSTALMSYYKITQFADGVTALRYCVTHLPALFIIGQHVSTSTGLDLIKKIKDDKILCDIPIIYVTDSDTAPNPYLSHMITKPYRRSRMVRTISQLLNTSIEHEWESLPLLQKQALKQSVDVFNSIADTIGRGEALPFSAVKLGCQPLVDAIGNNDFKTILNGVRNHDDYTYAHSMRVATMLSLLGHAAGFTSDEQLLLASGGLLHDVGKMYIPHDILNKPGRLTDEEFTIMKSHVPETVNYLKMVNKDQKDIPNAVFIIAEQHHEKLDGSGYPNGLNASQLNELARMAAVVDVFSALTDRRVYKEAMPAEKAIDIMEKEMVGHLDPHFIRLFKTILSDAALLEE